MKGIIRFLLRTGAGQAIVTTLLDLILFKVKDAIARSSRPRDHKIIVIDTLNAVNNEVREELAKELKKL